MEEWYTVSSLYPEQPDSNLNIRCMTLYNGSYACTYINKTDVIRRIYIPNIPNDEPAQYTHLRKVFKCIGQIKSVTIHFSKTEKTQNQYYAIITYQIIYYNDWVDNLMRYVRDKNNPKYFVSGCLVYAKWEPNENYTPMKDDMVDTFIEHYKDNHIKIQDVEIYDVYIIEDPDEDLLEDSLDDDIDIYKYAPNFDITQRLYNALIRHKRAVHRRLEQIVNEEPEDFYGDDRDMSYRLR